MGKKTRKIFLNGHFAIHGLKRFFLVFVVAVLYVGFDANNAVMTSIKNSSQAAYSAALRVYGLVKISSTPNLYGASLINTQPEPLPENLVVAEDNPSIQDVLGEAIESEIIEDVARDLPEIQKDTTQEQIDDLLEKIDLLKRQIADLQKVKEEIAEESDEVVLVQEEEEKQVETTDQPIIVVAAPITTKRSSGGSSSSSRPIYPLLLISEIQIR